MPEFHVLPGRPPTKQSVVIVEGAPLPSSYEQLTVSNSSVGLASIPSGVAIALIQVDDATIRWRDDGGAPTTTTGIRGFQANFIQLNTETAINNFRAIREGGTNATLNILYYAK